MSNYNKVLLMGRLTRDPELKWTKSQLAVCNIGLAVNRRFKDGQSGEWREETTFVDVTIFGKRGEAFSEYHQKGSSAFIEGSLRLDQWDDKNTGQKRSKLYVVADNWEFVGSSGGGGSRATAPAGAAVGGGGGSGGGGDGGGGGGGGDHAPIADDDIPF